MSLLIPKPPPIPSNLLYYLYIAGAKGGIWRHFFFTRSFRIGTPHECAFTRLILIFKCPNISIIIFTKYPIYITISQNKKLDSALNE
jgi:hypothetical protein